MDKIQFDELQILESSKEGKEFEVVLIAPGKSKNGFTYPPEMLKKAAQNQLFEGVRAFAYRVGDKFDHIPESGGRDRAVQNLVGDYVNTRYEEGRGVVATFRVMASWVRDLLKNSFEAGTKLLGFSIDGQGLVKNSIVEELFKIDEVTLVTNPAAGGEVLRMVASEQQNKETEQMNDLIKRLNKALGLNLPEDATPERVAEAIQQAERPAGVSKSQVSAWIREALDLKESIQDEIKKREELKEAEAKAKADADAVEKALKESKLPEKVIAKVRESIDGLQGVTLEKINKILKAEQEQLAAVKEGVNVPGQEEKISVGAEAIDHLNERLDAMWNFGQPNEGSKVEGFSGLHEAVAKTLGFHGSPMEYTSIIMTAMNSGARPVGSQMTAEQYAGMLRESHQIDGAFKTLGVNLKESTTTSSDFATALSSSMNRFLIKQYEIDRQTWRKIVTINAAKDFRALDALRVGGFNDLSTVAEDQAYTNFDKLSDGHSTYSVSKKGNTYPVSFEVITNDDIGLIRRNLQSMAQSAARTLNKAVMNVLYTNAAMDYDSTTLFHANHANTTTSALATATLDAGILAMANQTDQDSGAILGLEPAFLLVPHGLRKTAMELTNTQVTLTSGRTETVPNSYISSYNLEVLSDPDLTGLDANNWYLIASPMRFAGIDVAFLGGKQVPEFFVQDQQTSGSVFTADVITWKVRHIWGIKAVEHRSFYGGIVA